MTSVLLLLLLAVPAPQGPATLAVYHYGEDLGLRDRIVAAGLGLDDMGGWLAGLAGTKAPLAPAALLPPLLPGERAVVVDRHRHGAAGRPPLSAGRLLWSSPDGRVTIRALDEVAYKAVAGQHRSCHGAFRLLWPGRPMTPAVFSGRGHRAVTPKPSIQALVAQVSQADLEAYVNTLVAFGTRRHGQPGELQAVQWAQAELASFGLATSLFDYDPDGDNVIAELPGQVDPSRIVVVGGHIDSLNFAGATAPAPGADDDASGVAGVLEIASILAQEDFAYTIRFCTWTGEELGLLGSEAYAAWLESQGADVVGMIQLDMTAYRKAGDTLSVDFVTNDSSPALNAFGADAYAAYVPGLQVNMGPLSGGTSDHRSFTRHGFPACFPFEDIGDYSPFIHTTQDVVGVSANDFPLATDITRGALAMVAELARPLGPLLAHTPLPDTGNEQGPYPVLASVTAAGGDPVVAAELHWRVDNGGWQTTAMAPTGVPDQWRADIPGQVSPARVDYYLVATDAAGDQGWLPDGFSPGEAWHSFVVGAVRHLAFYDFEGTSDQGWTHGQVATQDDWMRDLPQGRSGSSYGVSWSDPAAAWSGDRCWGNDLGPSGWNGAYASNVFNWLASPPLDFTGETGVRLHFQRWLTVEDGQYDHARILVDGNLAWQNPVGSHVLDSAWTPVELDISPWADGRAGVQIRFELESDGGLELGGWNLDDVELLSIGPAGSTDTILLTGTGEAGVGDTLSYLFTGMTPGAAWSLLYSLRDTGTLIQGHPFDLGDPWFVAATGTADPAGIGAWSGGPVPPKAAGRTVFVEVLAVVSGQIQDSNLLALRVR